MSLVSWLDRICFLKWGRRERARWPSEISLQYKQLCLRWERTTFLF